MEAEIEIPADRPTDNTKSDSIHMHLLEKALKKTTSKCVSSFRQSLFKRQFEPIFKKKPQALQKLHEEATSQLTSNIEGELAMMFEEENIGHFMQKMDEMKAQADTLGDDVIAWRPSGCPADDARAHLQPMYRQHLHQLQKIFDQLQSQNTLLRRSLKKEQDKLLQSRSAVEDHLNTWKQANCLRPEDQHELETFVKTV